MVVSLLKLPPLLKNRVRNFGGGPSIVNQNTSLLAKYNSLLITQQHLMKIVILSVVQLQKLLLMTWYLKLQ